MTPAPTPSCQVHDHQIAELEASRAEIKAEVAATRAELRAEVHGNGKPGLRERVARLEYALAVMALWLATSSPAAAAILKLFGK